VRSAAKGHGENGRVSLKYLWIYVTHAGIEQRSEGGEVLSAEDWLSVIDESAAHGARYVIISLGAPLSEHPEVLEICRWAQEAQQMSVGIHLFDATLTREEAERLAELDTDRTWLFMEADVREQLPAVDDLQLNIYDATGQDQEVVAPECHLPEEMTCVGANGSMYTCGLVLGDRNYGFGNFFNRRLNDVMKDESLPHHIPEGLPKSHHKCNGCPPLMVQRMKEAGE
jgi:radical SAM protein with 4Fe4S-binding SPASM domain